MSAASLSHGAGPGSTITLTPDTIRVRDAIIEKFKDKSLAELNSFIETALSTEKDENKRLGILAARIYILRMRMQNIAAFNADPSLTTFKDLTPAQMLPDGAKEQSTQPEPEPEADPMSPYEEWNELIVIEAGEINGVRIPKGVTINVNEADAKRLIETKKAVFANAEQQPAEDPQAAPSAQDEELPPSSAEADKDTEIETETAPAQESQTDEADEAETGSEEGLPADDMIAPDNGPEQQVHDSAATDIELSAQTGDKAAQTPADISDAEDNPSPKDEEQEPAAQTTEQEEPAAQTAEEKNEASEKNPQG